MQNLLVYFRHELKLLSQQGKYFSRRFPVAAQKLGMSKGNFDDPHISRLMESFALLSAQIHQRLDDDLPEIAKGVMDNLAPQFLRTFPSVCITKFSPDREQSGMTQTRLLPKGELLESAAVHPHACRFVTHYPLQIWPADLTFIALTPSREDDLWRLHLTLTSWPGAHIQEKSLRLWLQGSVEVTNTLLALLTTQVSMLKITSGEQCCHIPEGNAFQTGFAQDELVMHHQARISPLHSLMLEFSLFPQRFHFIELPIPESITLSSHSSISWEFTFHHSWLSTKLASLVPLIGDDTFQLNCTPAINLFPCRAEPINLQSEISEYPVIADIHSHQCIQYWSMLSVSLRKTFENEMVNRTLSPLLGLNHHQIKDSDSLYWQVIEREQLKNKCVVKMPYIAFADRQSLSAQDMQGVIIMALLCSNGEFPAKMANGHPDGDFLTVNELPCVKIHALTRPSSPVAPPTGALNTWRLISQLTLNHLLLQGENGLHYLKETLALYNFNQSPHLQQGIALMSELKLTPICERLCISDPHSMARGVAIELIFDINARHFSEYTLFCTFMDRFLGLYAPVNSFTRLVTRIDGLVDSRQQWTIRAGRLSWL